MIFLSLPIEIYGNGKVEGIRLKDKNGVLFDIETNLIIKSIGYRATTIDNLKMDKTNNFILNNDGHIEKNIYTTGWASSPSVGVIGTNKGKAIETVKKIQQQLIILKKILLLS